MKKCSLYLFVILCIVSCDNNIIVRENIGNPMVYNYEGISFHYYLTTTKGELSTTYKERENFILHFDIINDSSEIPLSAEERFLNPTDSFKYYIDESIQFHQFTSQPIRDWSQPSGWDNPAIIIDSTHVKELPIGGEFLFGRISDCKIKAGNYLLRYRHHPIPNLGDYYFNSYYDTKPDTTWIKLPQFEIAFKIVK